MNLVKNIMPIPLSISNFEFIFDHSFLQKKNEEVIWILKKGITICSIGLHNQDKIKQEKGKSSLLNYLFFTNFCSSQSKHKIV